MIASPNVIYENQTLVAGASDTVQFHMPVNAFLPAAEDPAGITFNTLNLTVFDSGLCSRNRTQDQDRDIPSIHYFSTTKVNHKLQCPKRTDLHWPMITWSPSFTRKAGEMCAGILECLFSYLGSYGVPKSNREFISKTTIRDLQAWK